MGLKEELLFTGRAYRYASSTKKTPEKQDCVYGIRKESDIPDENLFSSTNKVSKKVIVYAAISWYGVTKITMVSKLTKKAIADICIRSCFLHKDWIFAQDGGPSHRSHLV